MLQPDVPLKYLSIALSPQPFPNDSAYHLKFINAANIDVGYSSEFLDRNVYTLEKWFECIKSFLARALKHLVSTY